MLHKILENFEKYKEKPCLYTDNKYYTYNDIYNMVKKIYGYLAKHCVSKQPVIVYGHKEAYMTASFLACSFFGIPYVPIDRAMPKERIESIVKKVNPQLIIGIHTDICPENITFSEMEEKIVPININMKPDDIYYIIFTSGSTGEPKGVKIMYRNICSCIIWLSGLTKPGHGEVILNQADYSFDLSVGDIYLSLYSGGCHFALENSSFENLDKNIEHFKKSGGTISVFTPSFAELLMCDRRFDHSLLPRLKYMLFCGETLSVKTVSKLKKRFPHTKIINLYGPTETTFAVTSIEIEDNMLSSETLPLGKPKSDVNIILSDKGEIIIQGESVGYGYTEESDRFLKINNIRSYKTGDFGYINKNGVLYYKGRTDDQIKLKGHRIELGDILCNIEALDYVDRAVVVPLYGKNKVIKKIVAFVKFRNKIFLQKDLKKRLPAYMIPEIVEVDSFPITTNGKCDINKLKEMYYT